VTNVVTPLPKPSSRLPKFVTSLTTDVTTTVVQTIRPVLQPAMGMTTPVLAPVLGSPPARSRPTVTTQSTTRMWTDRRCPAGTAGAGPARYRSHTQIPSLCSRRCCLSTCFSCGRLVGREAVAAPSPRVPLGDDGTNHGRHRWQLDLRFRTTGQMFGISRAFFGVSADRLAVSASDPARGRRSGGSSIHVTIPAEFAFRKRLRDHFTRNHGYRDIGY